MRRIIFVKAMQQFGGYRDGVRSIISMTPMGENGLKYIREMINEPVKQHILNREDQLNRGAVALSPKDYKKLQKIFPMEMIEGYLDTIEGKKTGEVVNIAAMPDRGFAGELSGYYSDACYTRLDNMLKDWPNVIPIKFVMDRESEKGKEIIGAVILIESVAATGEKVLIIRADNPRDEYLKFLDAKGFSDEVAKLAKKYAEKRGIKKVLISTLPGTISNREKINSYVKDTSVGKKIVPLAESLTFNLTYEIQNSCVEV